MFYVTIGTWKTKPVDIELKLGKRKYHSKPHLVPHTTKSIFKK